MLELTFQLTEDEVQAIWQRVLLRRYWVIALPLLMAGVCLIGVLLSEWLIILIGAGCGAYLVADAILAPRRVWRGCPTLRERQIVTVDDDHLVVQLPGGTSTIDWADCTSFERVHRAYVLGTDGRWVIIPRRAFTKHRDDRRFNRLGRARIETRAPRPQGPDRAARIAPFIAIFAALAVIIIDPKGGSQARPKAAPIPDHASTAYYGPACAESSVAVANDSMCRLGAGEQCPRGFDKRIVRAAIAICLNRNTETVDPDFLKAIKR